MRKCDKCGHTLFVDGSLSEGFLFGRCPKCRWEGLLPRYEQKPKPEDSPGATISAAKEQRYEGKPGEIECCPTCGQIISRREIGLYSGIIQTLGRVYRYLISRGDGYNFTRQEVKHLFLNENDTARFGDLVMFGGLVFKEKKAHYGLNFDRCQKFFKGEYKIPTKAIKDPISGELKLQDYKKIGELPNLTVFLDKDGFYTPKYHKRGEA